MRFSQHVYGRVSRGYRGAAEGYQVAALSDHLADQRQLCDCLNQLSFFNAKPGTEGAARYSFFRPADGLLAFGRACLAEDLSGSVGTFAHHYICREQEFVDSGASAARVLRALSFFGGEAELPRQTRSLELLEQADLPRAAPPAASPLRELALQVIDRHLDRDMVHLPLVVLAEAEAEELLEQVFDLLPRTVAVRCSFSTLYVGAAQWASHYRLALIPARELAPAGSSLFQLVDPAADQQRPAPASGFAALWAAHPEAGPALATLVDAVASGQHDQAGAARERLLPLGRALRSALEAVGAGGLEPLLLSRADWLVAYYRAGAPLPWQPLEQAIWSAPAARLPHAVTACGQLGLDERRDRLLVELGQRVASQAADPDLVGALARAGHCAAFNDAVQRLLPQPALLQLATRLRHTADHDRGLHDHLARLALAGLGDAPRKRDRQREQWLAEESSHLPGRGLLAGAAALLRWADDARLLPRPLAGLSLDDQQYIELVRAGFDHGQQAGFKPAVVLQALLVEAHRWALVTFLCGALGQIRSGRQKQYVGGLIETCALAEHEHLAVVNALLGADVSRGVLRYYRKALSAHAPQHQQAISRLKQEEQKKGLSSLFKSKG